MTRNYINILLSLFLLIVFSCANVSAPTGGPKDTAPPVIQTQVPEQGTTNFTDKKIRIWFDEYVNVKDLNSQFISSPPLQKPPKFLLKGKSVEFTITDTLKENTTYHFNFGDAIVDVNESNPLKNYNIAFSTGNEIDSLQIKGQIFDAFNLQAVENVLLLLYNTENFYDSIPYQEIPDYIARSDKQGNFEITYLKYGSYKLFALEDINKNRIFDVPNERIAFIDSIIMPSVDSINVTDTISVDSTNSYIAYKYFPDSLKLALFEEENYQQYIKDSKREVRDIFYIIMNDSLTKNTKLKAINFSLDDCYTEFSWNRDSISFYIEDTNTAKIDTLLLQMEYQKNDSLNNLSYFTDTLKFIFKEKKQPKRKKKDQIKEVEKKLIDVKFNVKSSGRLDLNSRLNFVLSYPIKSIDKNKISLKFKEDTLYKKMDFKIVKDSVNQRKYYVDFNLEENTNYSLFIDTNAFENNFGLTNDTILHNFSSQEEAYYGLIKLTITNLNQQAIIQVLKSDDKFVTEKIISNNSIVEFPFIKAGDYKLKLIFDDNKNKKWDTGKYLEALHPEKIIYYKETINVKSNWDIEIFWDIGQ